MKKSILTALILVLLPCLALADTQPKVALHQEIRSAKNIFLSVVIAAECTAGRLPCTEFKYVLAGGKAKRWKLNASMTTKVGSLVYVIDRGDHSAGILLEVEKVPSWLDDSKKWIDEYWVLVPDGYETAHLTAVRIGADRCVMGMRGMDAVGPDLCRYRAAIKLPDLVRVRSLNP